MAPTLAFINALLTKYAIHDQFEGVRIGVPLSVIIGTDVFDEFMKRNNLWVSPERFDRSRTAEIAQQIGRLNDVLHRENKGCLLIGPGRWGTREPWLGIPVSWEQISSAKVIIEAAYGDFCRIRLWGPTSSIT